MSLVIKGQFFSHSSERTASHSPQTSEPFGLDCEQFKHLCHNFHHKEGGGRRRMEGKASRAAFSFYFLTRRRPWYNNVLVGPVSFTPFMTHVSHIPTNQPTCLALGNLSLSGRGRGRKKRFAKWITTPSNMNYQAKWGNVAGEQNNLRHPSSPRLELGMEGNGWGHKNEPCSSSSATLLLLLLLLRRTLLGKSEPLLLFSLTNF